MDSLMMIVLKVLAHYVLELVHRGQDQMIEALFLDGPDGPFCERIEVRASGGKLDGLNTRGLQEGKNAMKWTKLSCHDFVDNQVRLQLFALAYSLGNFLRRLVLPAPVKHWTMTTMREKLIKIGAKVVHHARRMVFQLAEVAIPRTLFAAILRRIERLRLVAPAPLRSRFCFRPLGWRLILLLGCPWWSRAESQLGNLGLRG